MTESPIFTIVHNNCSIDKTLCWAGDETIYVVANGDTKVPYDIWSMGDSGQHQALLADVASGAITLKVGVYNGTEYIETEMKPCAVVTVKNTLTTPVTQKPDTLAELAEADKAFNIVAKTDTTEYNKDYYAVKKSEHVSEVENMDGDSSEKGDELQSEPVEPVVDVDGETDEEKFNKLCEAKRWSEALAVLKKVFGDKVTFGSRALIPLKTWSAVVEKYKLEA